MNFSKKQALATVALSLLLGQAHAEYWSTDELVKGFNGVSAQIDRGELQAAEQALSSLQRNVDKSDVRIEQYQRELAGAYLKQGQQQLAAQDTTAAAASLTKAQPYMSKAPGLKDQYQQSLAAVAQKAAPAAPITPPAPAKAAPSAAELAAKAKQDAERAQQQKLAAQKAAADRETAAQVARQAAEDKAAALAAAAQPRAQLIDPKAASSSVPLPMLDAQDREALRKLLDVVAADVVAFDCAVRLEVREAKDYPFVAALLSARIKKLEPGFTPQFSPVLKPDQEPRLVLSPQSNG
ncbi:MAG: PA5502 family lipoprotein [Pseudomonas sp.]